MTEINVVFTANLAAIFPQRTVTVSADTINAVLDQLENRRANFLSYILEDNGDVRKHVNLFLDDEMIDKAASAPIRTKTLASGSTLHIMQALSGG